jgi:hypothetical protein
VKKTTDEILKELLQKLAFEEDLYSRAIQSPSSMGSYLKEWGNAINLLREVVKSFENF